LIVEKAMRHHGPGPCQAQTAIAALFCPVSNPGGQIVAETEGEADELVIHACDLDATAFGKRTIFDFARHRRPEHYRMIVERTGAVPPGTDAHSHPRAEAVGTD
jgi:hypothetical protein